MRAFVRALGATLVGLAVVWLVTAASDEGQLTVGARAGRSLPLAPLASAVGAALALGTPRVREEAHALETLGRSPAETARSAAYGAAVPSLVVAIAIAIAPQVDIAAFYPRAPKGDTFVRSEDGFVSPSLSVAVSPDGTVRPMTNPAGDPGDSGLPHGARGSAALATGLAGLALALVSGRSVLRQSLLDREGERRRRIAALAQIVLCAVATVFAFQAAAARIAPAALAVVPPTLLLGAVMLGYRRRHA